METLGHNHDKTATSNVLPQNPPTGGASYPFSIPPPPTAYSVFYMPPPPPPPFPMNPIFCRFLGCILITVAVVTMTIFIAWTILKPQLPTFRVDSASVTLLNATDPYLTATWNFTLVVTNPNHRLHISYDAVSTSVLYGQDQVLAHTLLPPFVQKTRAVTALQIQCAVVDEFVDSGVATGLASDRAGGWTRFGLTFWASIKFKNGIFQTSAYLLKANCKPLRFAFSPQNGTGALVHSFLCV